MTYVKREAIRVGIDAHSIWQIVSYITGKGGYAIVDPHNYGKSLAASTQELRADGG
jgi:hypothetical protein